MTSLSLYTGVFRPFLVMLPHHAGGEKFLSWSSTSDVATSQVECDRADIYRRYLMLSHLWPQKASATVFATTRLRLSRPISDTVDIRHLQLTSGHVALCFEHHLISPSPTPNTLFRTSHHWPVPNLVPSAMPTTHSQPIRGDTALARPPPSPVSTEFE